MATSAPGAEAAAGLTSTEAARRLAACLREVVADETRRVAAGNDLARDAPALRGISPNAVIPGRRSDVWVHLGGADSVLAHCAAVALLAVCGVGGWQHLQLAVVGVLLVANAWANAWLASRRVHALRWEKVARVNAALQEFEASMTSEQIAARTEEEAEFTSRADAQHGNAGGAAPAYRAAFAARIPGFTAHVERETRPLNATPFSSPAQRSVSSAFVYRDETWFRLPVTLLVSGDIVALSAGDTAPAKVTPVDAATASRVRSSATAAAGLGRLAVPSPSMAGVPPVVYNRGSRIRPTRATAALHGKLSAVLAGGIADLAMAPEDERARSATSAARPFVDHAATDGVPAQLGNSEEKRPPAHVDTVAGGGGGGGGSVTVAAGGLATAGEPLPPIELPNTDEGILELCSEMRLYEVLEPPLRRELRTRLGTHHAGRFEPLFVANLRYFAAIAQRVLSVGLLLMAIACCVRVVVTEAADVDASQWVEAIAPPLVGMLMCALPLSLPTLLVVAEALATASLLAHQEVVLIRQRYKNWFVRVQRERKGSKTKGWRPGTAAQSGTRKRSDSWERLVREDAMKGCPVRCGARTMCLVCPETGCCAKRCPRARSWCLLTRLRCAWGPNQRAKPQTPRSTSQEAENVHSADSGVRLIGAPDAKTAKTDWDYGHPCLEWVAGKQWKRISWQRLWYHFCKVLSAPSLQVASPQLTRSKEEVVDLGFGVRSVETPPVSSQLLLRLGACTTFACLDSAVLCEPYPVPESVLLLKGERHSAALNIHTDDGSRTGLRFDEVSWTKYLSSLKPIGLAALLHARGHDDSTPGAAATSDSAKMAATVQTAKLPSTSSSVSKFKGPKAAHEPSKSARRGISKASTGGSMRRRISAWFETKDVVRKAVEQLDAGSDYGGDSDREDPAADDRSVVSQRSRAESKAGSAADRGGARESKSESAAEASSVPAAQKLDASSPGRALSAPVASESPPSTARGAAAPDVPSPGRASTDGEGSSISALTVRVEGDAASTGPPSPQTESTAVSTVTHRLVSAVRRVPRRVWLTQLSLEIGFAWSDVADFRHVRHIHTMLVVPRVVYSDRAMGSAPPLVPTLEAPLEDVELKVEAGATRRPSDRAASTSIVSAGSATRSTARSEVVVTVAEPTVEGGDSGDHDEPSDGGSSSESSDSDSEHTKSVSRVSVSGDEVEPRQASASVEEDGSLARSASLRSARSGPMPEGPAVRFRDRVAVGVSRSVDLTPSPSRSSRSLLAARLPRPFRSSRPSSRRRASAHNVDVVWSLVRRKGDPRLSPQMTCTVFQDRKSGRLQLMSQGEPEFLLDKCTEYWDGETLLEMTEQRRQFVKTMAAQWRAEDFICVALGYDPVSDQEASMFSAMDSKSRRDSSSLRVGLGMTQKAIYLVEQMSGSDGDPGGESLPAVLGAAGDRAAAAAASGAATAAAPARSLRSFGEPRPSVSGPQPLHGAKDSDVGRLVEERLHKIQSGQIFLGMVASRIEPKPKVEQMIRRMNTAGIRFVYMSPRSYKKTKQLASKMGLDTDWNTAISLKPLIGGDRVGDIASNEPASMRNSMVPGDSDEDMVDPDKEWWEEGDDSELLTDDKRQKSQSTRPDDVWDVKAQLPHGVPAIKRHLREKDNVPLLVSLFTNSSPDTIRGMLRVMRSNGEMVCVVGSALRKQSPMLFAAADVAISIAAMEPVPASLTATPVYPNPLLRLACTLNSLSCGLTLPATARLHIVLKLIEESRRSLDNLTQSIAFLACVHGTIGLLLFLTTIAAFPVVISIADVAWILWVLGPLLALSLIGTPEGEWIMSESRTPEKNEVLMEANDYGGVLDADDEPDVARQQPQGVWARFRAWWRIDVGKYLAGSIVELQVPDPPKQVAHYVLPSASRFSCYFIGRFLPGTLITLAIYVVAAWSSGEDNAGAGVAPPLVYGLVDNRADVHQHARSRAMTLFALGLWLAAASVSFVYRAGRLRDVPPWRNRVWCWTVAAALVLHTLYCSSITWYVAADHFLATQNAYAMIASLVWPLLSVLFDDFVKASDIKLFERQMLKLRLAFDTKLGMHSPK